MSDFLQQWKDRKIKVDGIDVEYTVLEDNYRLGLAVCLNTAPSKTWVELFHKETEDASHLQFEATAKAEVPRLTLYHVPREAPLIERAYSEVDAMVLRTNQRFLVKRTEVMKQISGLVAAIESINQARG